MLEEDRVSKKEHKKYTNKRETRMAKKEIKCRRPKIHLS